MGMCFYLDLSGNINIVLINYMRQCMYTMARD